MAMAAWQPGIVRSINGYGKYGTTMISTNINTDHHEHYHR